MYNTYILTYVGQPGNGKKVENFLNCGKEIYDSTTFNLRSLTINGQVKQTNKASVE